MDTTAEASAFLGAFRDAASDGDADAAYAGLASPDRAIVDGGLQGGVNSWTAWRDVHNGRVWLVWNGKKYW